MEKLALLFPGQGSQSVGMLSAFADHQDTIDTTMEEAREALGYSLAELIDNGPEDKLNLTEYTQPAILAASIAIFRIRGAQELNFAYVAGHSLGEYSALVATGALEFGAALKLVRARGQLMQEAVKPGEGKMAAIIGADLAKLEEVCQQHSSESASAEIANYNSHKQVVISGHTKAIDAVLEQSEAYSAKRAVVLPVTVPSHSSLMQPAAEQFANHLNDVELKAPGVPILPNVDPQPTTDPDHIRACLYKQLSSSVQWVRTIETMAKGLGVADFQECGPGRVLSSLLRQTL